MKNHSFWLCTIVLSISLIFPGLVSAQKAVGIVTALKGKAQLTRAATQTALRFKDDLNLRDLIDTQERSLARVLFGGKSTVTVRELLTSVNSTITATSGAVLDLSSTSTMTNTAGPVVKIEGGSVTADSRIDTDESGNTFKFTGTILDLKDTTATFRIIADKVNGSTSSLNVTGALVNFGPGGTGGSTIIVRNNLCSGTRVTLGSPAINVFKPSGTITISGTSIKNSSLGSIDAGSTDAVIQTVDGSVTIQGN